MSLTASFTAQSVFGSPNSIFLTDTSTGSDSAVKARVVYLRLYNGAYLNLSGQPDSVIVVPEVKATCFLGGLSLQTTGVLFTVNAVDPILGVVILATYTQQAGDTTTSILATNIINAVNTNTITNGYGAQADTLPGLDIVAKAGLGATINGLVGNITWAGGSTSSTFSGGVSQASLPLSGQNYIYWPYADNTLLINILTQDTAVSITTNWLGATNNILYTSTVLTVFNQNAQMYLDYLISGQQAYPPIVSATNYFMYQIQLELAISNAINSISDMSDITNSQQWCDRGTYLITNANLFF